MMMPNPAAGQIAKAEKLHLPILRLALLLAIPFVLSCASTSLVPSTKSRVITQIPFFPQDDYQCGPASLAAVLAYRGAAVTPAGIAAEIFSGSARGTLDMDMVLYAEGKGLKVKRYAGTPDDLRRNIDSGNPLIVLTDYGFWVYEKGHYMVIVGYNDQGFIVISGKDRELFVPEAEFLKVWKKANFLTLLIERP
jgi:ABC-type bacteriocin/lantibiotic exporter with double-glycine peptidase domain